MPSIVRDTRSLAYAVHGAGSPALLIHGLGSSQQDWGLQVEHLAPLFQVITIDLPGHGRSSGVRPPCSMRDLGADVVGVLDHLGLGPCHVVGLSLGGMIAFQMALDTPRTVKSLTIVNSGPAVVPRTLAQHLAVKVRLLGARFLPMDRLATQIGKGLFPHPEQAELRRTFRERFAKNRRESYRAVLDAIVGWSVAERVGAIEVPTLVVTGDRDYTPVAAKHAYAALMPDASVVTIHDSGHATPIDQPDAFNAVLSGFLTRVDAGSDRLSTPARAADAVAPGGAAVIRVLALGTGPLVRSRGPGWFAVGRARASAGEA